MQRYFVFLISLIVLFLIIIGRSYTKRSAADVTEKKELMVVCTTGMIADVVKQVGQDYVQVTGLMGPGIDPHLYKAREGDVHRLANADIIFFNGLHLEGKMGDLLGAMKKNKCTNAVAEIIPEQQLIEGDFQGTFDPHVWHDVSLWICVVEGIKNILIEQDVKHANYYQENAKQYIAKLQQLDEYVKKEARRLSDGKRILVTAHDAFHYFGKAYDFNVVGLQGISTDAEISTKDIQTLADFIVEHKVSAVFVESSIPERNIQAVQKAVQSRGWQVAIGPELFSDALGNKDSNAGTYHGMIKHNIDAIIAALQKE